LSDARAGVTPKYHSELNCLDIARLRSNWCERFAPALVSHNLERPNQRQLGMAQVFSTKAMAKEVHALATYVEWQKLNLIRKRLKSFGGCAVG